MFRQCYVCREFGSDRATVRGIVLCYPCWADVEEAKQRLETGPGGKPERVSIEIRVRPDEVVPPDPLQMDLPFD